MPSVLPNFFILGAAKCGTTTLYRWLRGHPEIYLPDVKEPQYFSNDDVFERGLDWYSRTYFSGAGGRPLRGEATPHYLAFPKVPHRIRAQIPTEGLRFLVVLRNPVDRAYSLYWNLRAEGLEPLPFEEALRAEPQRVQDPLLIRRGSLRYRYVSSGMYAEQLESFFACFERSAFQVLFYEDLTCAPEDLVASACRFLGTTPPSAPIRKVAANPAGTPRSIRLQRFVREPHRAKTVLRRLLPFPLRQRIAQGLLAWNKRAEPYPPMPEETRRSLQQRFRPDVERLMEITGRDLGDWLR